MKKDFRFVVKPYNDKFAVFRRAKGSDTKQLEIAHETYDRAEASRELLEFWYEQGRKENASV